MCIRDSPNRAQTYRSLYIIVHWSGCVNHFFQNFPVDFSSHLLSRTIRRAVFLFGIPNFHRASRLSCYAPRKPAPLPGNSVLPRPGKTAAAPLCRTPFPEIQVGFPRLPVPACRPHGAIRKIQPSPLRPAAEMLLIPGLPAAVQYLSLIHI